MLGSQNIMSLLFDDIEGVEVILDLSLIHI